MKKNLIILIYFTTLISNLSISQKKENDVKSISTEKKGNLFINEFNLSINKWSKIGFGGGMYHQQYFKNRVSSIIGIEYNQVSQFYPTVFQGNHTIYKNEIDIYSVISFPMAIRIHIDKRKLLSFETGIAFDYVFSVHEIGMSLNDLDKNGNYNHSGTIISNIRRKEDSIFPGISSGLVLKIPFKKNAFVIKADYKFSSLHFARFSIGYAI